MKNNNDGAIRTFPFWISHYPGIGKGKKTYLFSFPNLRNKYILCQCKILCVFLRYSHCSVLLRNVFAYLYSWDCNLTERCREEWGSPEPQPSVHMSALLSYAGSHHWDNCNSAGRVTSADCVPQHWQTIEESYGDSHWLMELLFLTQSPVSLLANSTRGDRTWLYKGHLSLTFTLSLCLSLPHAGIHVVFYSRLCNCCNNWLPLPPESQFGIRMA